MMIFRHRDPACIAFAWMVFKCHRPRSCLAIAGLRQWGEVHPRMGQSPCFRNLTSAECDLAKGVPYLTRTQLQALGHPCFQHHDLWTRQMRRQRHTKLGIQTRGKAHASLMLISWKPAVQTRC